VKRTVSLFIPCFVDQSFLRLGSTRSKCCAALGTTSTIPRSNVLRPARPQHGILGEARPCAEHFVRVFKNADVVVCPSGSCVSVIRLLYPELLAHSPLREEALSLASRTFEFSEFLVKVEAITRSALASAHGDLPRFLPRPPRTRPAGGALKLLRQVDGLKLIEMVRSEECCGFGGTFAVKFADIPAPWEIPRLTASRDQRRVRHRHRSQLLDAPRWHPRQTPIANPHNSPRQYPCERRSEERRPPE